MAALIHHVEFTLTMNALNKTRIQAVERAMVVVVVGAHRYDDVARYKRGCEVHAPTLPTSLITRVIVASSNGMDRDK
jgi:hypothetical protein